MSMSHGKTIRRGTLLGLVIAGVALPVRAQDDNGAPVTRADFNKLQNEVREQRKLIIQMLQTEQQRYDMLLRLMQGAGGDSSSASAAAAAAGTGGGAAPGDEGAPAESSPATAKQVRAEASREREREHERRLGSIEGKVQLTGGGDPGEVYVYVDGLKAPLARGKSLEIKQQGRQFAPRSAVVQAGTSVTFPNYDSIYHNVFSNSPRNSFDLGAYRAGDKPRAVTLQSAGVVDVFCNMHQKMSARILVVPNSLYTRVRPDGSFKLENVPVGQRRVVAWGPRTKPAQQRVEVSAAGSQTSFVLEREEPGAHTNKMGQAYGSYRD
jgi:plastocyanin